jgi:hypothetical protein
LRLQDVGVLVVGVATTYYEQQQLSMNALTQIVYQAFEAKPMFIISKEDQTQLLKVIGTLSSLPDQQLSKEMIEQLERLKAAISE